MLNVSPGIKIYVYRDSTDMRKGSPWTQRDGP